MNSLHLLYLTVLVLHVAENSHNLNKIPLDHAWGSYKHLEWDTCKSTLSIGHWPWPVCICWWCALWRIESYLVKHLGDRSDVIWWQFHHRHLFSHTHILLVVAMIQNKLIRFSMNSCYYSSSFWCHQGNVPCLILQQVPHLVIWVKPLIKAVIIGKTM